MHGRQHGLPRRIGPGDRGEPLFRADPHRPGQGLRHRLEPDHDHRWAQEGREFHRSPITAPTRAFWCGRAPRSTRTRSRRCALPSSRAPPPCSYVTDRIKPVQAPSVFPQTAPMFAALAAGQVDAVLFDTPTVLAQAKQSHGAFRVAGRYDMGEKWGGLVNKDSPNLAAFNKLIDDFKNDGTLQRLTEQLSDPRSGHGSRQVAGFHAVREPPWPSRDECRCAGAGTPAEHRRHAVRAHRAAPRRACDGGPGRSRQPLHHRRDAERRCCRADLQAGWCPRRLCFWPWRRS